MPQDGYNGWTNWETWNTYNWLSSYEGQYRWWSYIASKCDTTGELAARMKRDITKNSPQGLRQDFEHMDGADWDAINWDEVAGAFMEE